MPACVVFHRTPLWPFPISAGVNISLVELAWPHAYQPVALVEADSPEVAYAATQHIECDWWSNEHVTLVRQSRSTSVGDVIEDAGHLWVAVEFGFRLLAYARQTPDGRCRASCAFRQTPLGWRWMWWTESPNHNPGSGTIAESEEAACRLVDAYIAEHEEATQCAAG